MREHGYPIVFPSANSNHSVYIMLQDYAFSILHCCFSCWPFGSMWALPSNCNQSLSCSILIIFGWWFPLSFPTVLAPAGASGNSTEQQQGPLWRCDESDAITFPIWSSNLFERNLWLYHPFLQLCELITFPRLNKHQNSYQGPLAYLQKKPFTADALHQCCALWQHSLWAEQL